MLSPKRAIGCAMLCAILLAMVPGCNSAQPTAKQQTSSKEKQCAPTDPVERVNGKAITRIELERAVKVLLAQSQAPQPLPPQVMQRARETALDQLVSAELLYQAAGKTAPKAVDQQVAQKIAESRARYQNEEEFQKSLKELGMNFNDLQVFTRKDVIINEFIAKRFAAKVTVSDAEARKFYDENRDKFKVDESLRASHILVGIDEKSPAEVKKKAREKAVALLGLLRKGGDFASIAKRESTCPSKANGGDLGIIAKGQTDPAFEKAAFALKAGDLSEVVETPFGYHIIKVTERYPAHNETYASAKKRILHHLKRDKTLKLVDDYLAELRSKAKIEKVA